MGTLSEDQTVEDILTRVGTVGMMVFLATGLVVMVASMASASPLIPDRLKSRASLLAPQPDEWPNKLWNWSFYKGLDSNKDGFVDEDEFRLFNKAFGEALNTDKMDTDNDGEISYEEFLRGDNRLAEWYEDLRDDNVYEKADIGEETYKSIFSNRVNKTHISTGDWDNIFEFFKAKVLDVMQVAVTQMAKTWNNAQAKIDTRYRNNASKAP